MEPCASCSGEHWIGAFPHGLLQDYAGNLGFEVRREFSTSRFEGWPSNYIVTSYT